MQHSKRDQYPDSDGGARAGKNGPRPLWNPYFGGFLLGLVLLGSFLFLGHGLGASGAASRVGISALNRVAPGHVQDNSYFATYLGDSGGPLQSWIVFAAIGVFIGGAVSSTLAGRRKSGVTRGPRISIPTRLAMALAGGVLMGFAARLARGCTSGQALSGGALM